MKEVRSLTPEETEVYNYYYHTYYKMILSIAKQMVGDQNIAEVAAQETFVTAWLKFDQFQSSVNPPGWLVIVAKNKCKQALRDRKRHLEHRVFVRNIENIAVQYDFDRIEPLVPEIPEKTLLKHYYEEGYTLREIAREYNVKISAMKMRLKRARDKMKQEILKRE